VWHNLPLPVKLDIFVNGDGYHVTLGRSDFMGGYSTPGVMAKDKREK